MAVTTIINFVMMVLTTNTILSAENCGVVGCTVTDLDLAIIGKHCRI